RDVCRRGETQLDPAALGFCCSTSTSTSGPTTTTVTTTSTTTTLGHCAFKGAPCTSDADCGIPGSCAPEGDCREKCATAADCPPGLTCFDAAVVGLICVGCGGNDAACPPGMSCHSATRAPGDSCAQFANPACTGTGGSPCTIPDACLPSP